MEQGTLPTDAKKLYWSLYQRQMSTGVIANEVKGYIDGRCILLVVMIPALLWAAK